MQHFNLERTGQVFLIERVKHWALQLRDVENVHLEANIDNWIFIHYLIYKVEFLCVCVFVCVSGIEIHTVGPILTKFGMGA